MDVASVADELYAADPAEFTATRTEREKQAKAAGDKELAKQIGRLRKPTVTAWLANLLVRERPDSLRPLTELGGQLQRAQQAMRGDAMRELSRQRHKLIYALVQEARSLAADVGQRVTEQVARELEQTLQAALADPDAAETLLAGRLTTALEHTGFGPQSATPPRRPAPATTASKSRTVTASTSPSPGAGPAPSKAGRASSDTDAGERRRAAARVAGQRGVQDAEKSLREATDALQASEDSAADLHQRQQDLGTRITALQRSLTEAEEKLTGVRRDARRAERQRERSAQARDRAERALTASRKKLDALG